RAHPNPAAVPATIRTMSRLGAFKNAAASGFYVGFIAGILGDNPRGAVNLAGRALPLPAEDDWVLGRAFAWSGLPDWQENLTAHAAKLRGRRAMIDKYLNGALPTLDEITTLPPPPPSGILSWFKKKPKERLPTGDNLDALWGYYIATGQSGPIDRIVTILPWAGEKNDVAKLTLGGMAKFMLASAAQKDQHLLQLLKVDQKQASDKVTARQLTEVIDAAEGVDAERIRVEETAAIDDLNKNGPYSQRNVSTWAKLSEGAIAVGCVAAAAAGQVELGVPCVVGGATAS